MSFTSFRVESLTNLKVYQRTSVARGRIITSRGRIIAARGHLIAARGRIITARHKVKSPGDISTIFPLISEFSLDL